MPILEDVSGLLASRTGRARLLDLDPDLAAGMTADEVMAARQCVTAAVIELPSTGWGRQRTPALPSDHALVRPPVSALLILRGTFLREVRAVTEHGASGREFAELLGPGDVLRPWQPGCEPGMVEERARWRTCSPALLAVLDRATMAPAFRWPSLVDELMDRALRRSRALALAGAINAVPTARERLLLLFFHLADRFGRVTPDGIVIDLSLTHEDLAHVTTLRRPTVTVTLGWLAREGFLARRSRSTWLLDAGAVAASGTPARDALDVEKSALAR